MANRARTRHAQQRAKHGRSNLFQSAGRAVGGSGYVLPLRGQVSRTDQGVDISAAPGTPVRAIGLSREVGVIPNWFKGQPFVWFELLKRAGGRLVGTGKYWYGAEQIRFSTHPGEVVEAGQQIGKVAPSGSGTEFGWATKSGSTLAKATTGYTEGQVTPAGKNFMASVIKGASAGGAAIADQGWHPCTLTWYDPALGGTNSASGARNPHSATASGQPYDARKFTCAAPPSFPFGTHVTFKYSGKTVTCVVNDRGGAIVGSHFDLSRAAAEKLGIVNAGKVSAQYTQGSGTPGDSSGVTRPDGSGGGDQSLLDAFSLAYIDNPDHTGPATVPISSPSQVAGGGTEFVGLSIPLFPGGPMIPGLPNPFDVFKAAEAAITDVPSFLKWIAWIFHPRNILRAVEFLAGLTVMILGIHTAIAANRGATTEHGTVRRTLGAATQATPIGRGMRVARGARAGRMAARSERRREEFNTARKRARRGAQRTQKTRRAERNTRSRYGNTPPF